ncbi:MAG: aminotransferase class V-fold PLP-dependent enzyme [Tenacibaculum sp.]
MLYNLKKKNDSLKGTPLLKNQSHLFNLNNEVTYLNCSYMSPMLRSVAQVGVEAIYKRDNPTDIKQSDFFYNKSRLRDEFAKLINADSKSCVIIPSVSYGMANVAKNLKAGKGDNIVVADEQFPSNIYAWMALEKNKGIELKRVAPPKNSKNRGKLWNEQLFQTIDQNTKMVACGHVHWTDGTLFDLMTIRKRADEVGAILVIDGTQSIGALPFDVQQIKPDALVVAGYKWLMGPYACGVAYYGDYFADGLPIENNWMNRLNSEDFTNLINYQQNYQSGMMRYEVGESTNFILAPMLTRALEQVNQWGPANIQAYTEQLTKPYVEELKYLGCSIEVEEYRSHHLFGVRLPEDISLEKLKEVFVREKIYVSVRGNSIRVASHLYNNHVDFKNLLNAFKQLK